MPNIAVLLEPFPIRNTFGAHAWIGERLAEMLLAEDNDGLALTDMRVVGNTPSLTYLVERHPSARPYLLQPPAETQAPFSALMADWHTIGIEVWRRIQTGSPEHEPLYENLLRAVANAYPLEVLAYWGTNETLRAVATRLGIPMLWAEYGPLRPPFATHFCLDGDGVNGKAGGRDSLAVHPATYPVGLPAAALEVQVGAVSAYEATMMLPSAEAAEPFATLMRFVKGNHTVILLVMQLADDANLLSFGEGWTCKAMVETMLKLRAGPGTVFIFRSHPGENNSYHNMQAGAEVRALIEHREDVLIFDDTAPAAYIACLSTATEVVSINSSVGFEALMLGKPVRVLGQASYMPSNGGADLTAAPVQLDESSVDTLLRDRYIPSKRFWTMAFWRDRAESVCAREPVLLHRLVPRLPTSPACPLGAASITADGLLVIAGLAPMTLAPWTGTGWVDEVVSAGANHLIVHGWAVDPATDGMLAGFVIIAGNQSTWCSVVVQRPDVARNFASHTRLASGFSMRIARQDMPAAWEQPISVYGVTASGFAILLNRRWIFDSLTGQVRIESCRVAA